MARVRWSFLTGPVKRMSRISIWAQEGDITATLNTADNTESGTSARRPRQQRSRERFAKLLDAADQLLKDRDISEIGLYDIAEAAGVPPASVYHFFPSKETAFAALATRYLEDLFDFSARNPFTPESVQQWPDLFRKTDRRTIDFFNRRPVMMKLLLSGAVSSEIRNRDIEYTRDLAERGYDWMNHYFTMPYLPGAHVKFATVWAIFDGVAMMSYARHGRITDQYAAEIDNAIIAYCRTFLPDVIALQPPKNQG